MAVIGLDIGGSKTRGLRVEGGLVVRDAVVGSANPSSVGLEVAGARLDGLLDQLGRDEVHAIGVGAAGADTPSKVALMRTMVAERLPNATVHVVHDAELVLAAEGCREGVALISGTGSVAWGRASDGSTARAGGWGHLLGDEGGGYAIVRDAVRHALRRDDAGLAPDELTAQLTAACGVDGALDLLDLFYDHQDRRSWARHAGLVFALADECDPAARAIVARAGGALVQLARTILARLSSPGPVVLAGGLGVHQPALVRTLSESLPVEVRVLSRAPAFGAVRLVDPRFIAPSGAVA